MLKLLISCCYDGVVVACRYMFAMGSDVVLVLLLLYCVNMHNMHGEKLKIRSKDLAVIVLLFCHSFEE